MVSYVLAGVICMLAALGWAMFLWVIDETDAPRVLGELIYAITAGLILGVAGWLVHNPGQGLIVGILGGIVGVFIVSAWDSDGLINELWQDYCYARKYKAWRRKGWQEEDSEEGDLPNKK